MDFTALSFFPERSRFLRSFFIQKTDSQGGGNNQDENLWKPEVDASGNGYAIIRFLPILYEELPWAQVMDSWIPRSGRLVFEKSLTTINQKDPVSEMNSRLWNSGDEDDKQLFVNVNVAREYYSNILVLSDPKNPDNEGKVFLYRHGKKIFGKIQER